ncbi:MAG TPA: hypothetical protein VHT27_12640 [Solirubrobacteraceae bacterium]|jgi:hypothetical protein|nr:hypothetical protein [Solirubrobacteraceae bacterium]
MSREGAISDDFLWPPSGGQAPPPHGPREPVRHLALKRMALAAATAFIAINIWTGAPLLALWIGSHVVGSTTLSMGAVGVVVVVLAVLVVAMAFALVWLNSTYEELTGVPRGERRHGWMRSMNTQHEDEEIIGMRVTALERIVVISVYLAMITFLVWFFFFAHLSVPA